MTALDALPEEQRTAIRLREFQGLSYPQVGAAMSCPVGTVRSRIFRARDTINQHLRRMLDDGRHGASGAGREARQGFSRPYLAVLIHAMHLKHPLGKIEAQSCIL